jgi:hypothetical protein
LFYPNPFFPDGRFKCTFSIDVIINDNFSEALCSLIQGYRSLSTDTTYIHMIDEIQSNGENLQGKTIRQILHEIK